MIHQNANLSIYLIRHAEAHTNLTPHIIGGRSAETLLTPKGEEQATVLGKKLAREGIYFDQIYTSPLVRSISTTNRITDELAYPRERVIQVPELVEFTQGDWEGKPREMIYTPETLGYINTKGQWFVPPNGESQRMVERRVSNWFEDEILYSEKYINQPCKIAIVSHGIVIKCFLHYVMHFDDRLIYRIRLDNTSLCVLYFNKEGWYINKINDISHLS